jgi:hypothetical protein
MGIGKAVVFFFLMALLCFFIAYIVYIVFPNNYADVRKVRCKNECTVFSENLTGTTNDGCSCICNTKRINICGPVPKISDIPKIK